MDQMTESSTPDELCKCDGETQIGETEVILYDIIEGLSTKDLFVLVPIGTIRPSDFRSRAGEPNKK